VNEARRVLVALDTLGGERGVLDLAARLAVACEAELAALIVENIALLQLAELPFIKEVDRLLGVEREMDRVRVRRLLRTEAARARRNLDNLAQRLNLRTSFRITRGRYIEAALRASAAFDLVLLDRAPASAVAKTDATWGEQIVVIEEHAACDRSAWETAGRLARARGAHLSVLAIGDQARRSAERDQNTPGARRLIVTCGCIDEAADELQRIQPALVVLARGSELGRHERLAVLIKKSNAPILLVPNTEAGEALS
jgi:hypothetical protein